ncbi:MAG: penicillin-binding protein 2, partial [Candidatus Pacebacteria bacterium]|nr:penicillin-binding protein 2 [Candidatus Paceibacterota bacterium]
IIIAAVAVLGIVVIGRLFSLQILNGHSYKERAEHQYVTPSSDSFDRGNIYFTSKDATTVAAATVASGFIIAITPNLIKDIPATYEALNAVIPIDREVFFLKAEKKKDPYEEIIDHVPESAAQAITQLKLTGVSLVREKWRFYPGESLAARAIGFVSFKGDTLVGSYGLEEEYNDVLSRDAKNFYVNFFAEIFANMQSSVFKNTATTGDIVTTIEPTVQVQLEQTVSDIQQRWGSESVGGIIMDPYTGSIVAMAAAPTFDLNKYGAVKDPNLYTNPFVQHRYEMGSIVKPLVMAGALDVGAITPTTTYTDKGFVTIDGKTLNNFDKKGRGANVSMQEVLNQSLNTGMIFVEQKMGKTVFKDYLVTRYKLGDKTGIDLPGEVNGSVGSLKDANDINYAAASFGQGIATSPINIVRAFATLANGGTMVTPHVASKIIEASGTSTDIAFPLGDRVLKPETVSAITNMLVQVVDDGYDRGLRHYSVAAKTGTAQIARTDGGGYYTDRNLHSLIGFFPASKPRYVLYLFNVYPKEELYAIQTLGDPFFDMVQFMNNYYGIAPDR